MLSFSCSIKRISLSLGSTTPKQNPDTSAGGGKEREKLRVQDCILGGVVSECHEVWADPC